MLADGPLYWKSSMVESLSLSSCESEIRAINMALEPIKEAIKIKQWIVEVNNTLRQPNTNFIYLMLVDHPLEILEDNSACIDWGNSTVNSTRLKHLERDLKWIQEEVQKKTIKLINIPTRSQLADIYTKPLTRDLFLSLRDSFMFNFDIPTKEEHLLHSLFPTLNHETTISLKLDFPLHFDIYPVITS